MDHTRFRKPVDILVGLGFPRRIESAIEGYILLQDWPHGDRSRAHSIALNACKAAIAGEIDPEMASATLRGFADKMGILIPNEMLVSKGHTAHAPASLGLRGEHATKGLRSSSTRSDSQCNYRQNIGAIAANTKGRAQA